MDENLPAEIAALDNALAAISRDAAALVEDLSATQAAHRALPSSWSVAECIDHLATANRIYLAAMAPAAARALERGRLRRGPAVPGRIGRWFVSTLEPPPRLRAKAPRTIQPRTAPDFPDALAAFLASHDAARRFLRTYAAIDLAGVRFPNPFIPGVRFSLATGLHVIAAHERRHLWQGWRAREAATRSARPAGLS